MSVWMPLGVAILTPLVAPFLWRSSRKLADTGRQVRAVVRQAYSMAGARVLSIEYELDGKTRRKSLDIHEEWGAKLSVGDKLEVFASAGFMGRVHVIGPVNAAPNLQQLMDSARSTTASAAT